VRHSKIYLLLILPLFAFIVVLVARTELIILFVLLIFIWLYHFLKRKKYVIGIGGVALIVFVSVLSVWKIPELNARFFDVLTDKKQVKNTWSIKNERESIWDVAWDRIKQKPMLGVGTGAGAAILTEDFKKDGYILLAKKTSLNNVHNQFIQQWFILGVLGLLSCLYLYANLFWQAYVSKSFILFVLAMILTIASLTECILESQSGIVFFVLFYAFFLVEQKEEPITNT
jgi:O-antigen ligase